MAHTADLAAALPPDVAASPAAVIDHDLLTQALAEMQEHRAASSLGRLSLSG
jgi:hypothetical protein